MDVTDLGTMRYRAAWALQEQAHDRVLAGDGGRLLLVEHPPVITFGRRPGQERHVVADEATLAARGVEVVASDRGGDVTFHGPGQIVAYPIVRLANLGLSVSGYVHRLEDVVIQTLARFGIAGAKDASAPGVWVADPTGTPAKICAVGVRIRRGVSMHGIALNVTTDLSFFELIVPCGLSGRPVTSMQRVLGVGPSVEAVKLELAERFRSLMAAGEG